MAGLVWQGQRIGLALSSLSDIKAQAVAAITALRSGQSALAQGDFAASEQAFSDASQSIQLAQTQLDEALLASQHVLSVVDVTGTVRSGANLLSVAEKLSATGAIMAHVVEQFSHEQALTDAIGETQPHLVQAAKNIEDVEALLGDISPSAVPAEVQPQLRQLQEIIPPLHNMLVYTSNQADALMSLLGAEHDRQYLLLLTNNHELRPVGGFIGTIALVNIDRGKVENVDVSSVYDGDGQLKQFIAPPGPLLPIVDRWYLRDTNWFADFPVSARKAAEFFEKEGGPTVDGVILLTPDVITRLLRVTGPITVPGYDQVVSAENFREITQQEVTYEYDKSLNRPKQFLADMTPILLGKIFDGPNSSLQVLGEISKSLAQKEMVLYFRNTGIQQRFEELRWTGSIPQDMAGLLHVNNANIGGHKSDQFIEQEIDQRIQVLEDGSAEVVLTVRRTHNGPFEAGTYEYPDGENPAQKDNVVFQRIFVPSGSQLLEAKGFTPVADIPTYTETDSGLGLTADPDVAAWQSGQKSDASGTIIGAEAGYKFFGNWVVTQPGQTSVGLYRYNIPAFADMPGVFDQSGSVSVSAIKQTGALRTALRIEIALPARYRAVYTAPEGGITQESDSAIVYRGDFAGDRVVGVVFARK